MIDWLRRRRTARRRGAEETERLGKRSETRASRRSTLIQLKSCLSVLWASSDAAARSCASARRRTVSAWQCAAPVAWRRERCGQARNAPSWSLKPGVADAGEKGQSAGVPAGLSCPRPAASRHARAGASVRVGWRQPFDLHAAFEPRRPPECAAPTIAVRFKPTTPARSRRSTKRLATIADMSLSALWASLRPPLTGCDGQHLMSYKSLGSTRSETFG